MSAYTPEEINALRPEVARGGFGGGDPSRWLATVDALRAERDALRSRVDAADAERDEALKVADVATAAAAKAVLDAKEVYEVRHLETIRRLKALLGEARPMVYIKANEFSEHEDVTLERQSVLARIDKEIAS